MDTLYKPGQKIPASGTYLVVHDQAHKPQREERLVQDQYFSKCPECKGSGPRYTMIAKPKPYKETAWV